MLDGLDGLRNCTIRDTDADGLTAVDIALSSVAGFRLPSRSRLIFCTSVSISMSGSVRGSFPLDVNVNH